MIKSMKFGGTSVGSVDALERMISIILKEEASKAVVVSAMSGITNSLVACLEGKGEISEMAEVLLERYSVAAKAAMADSTYATYKNKLEDSIGKLSEVLEQYSNNPCPPLEDTIVSWGERLSSLTVAYILQSRGADGVSISSEEAGIIASGTYGNGSADLEATHENLQKNILPLLEDGVIPILTGYYGIGPEGKPMTFGRGGSDYSSSVVACGLEADCCEIWTEVNGFMTADPRVVPEAFTIHEMDYSEAAELAYFGAKVLHPRTVEPVRKRGIALAVKNTFNPDFKGTIIRNIKNGSKGILRSVASKTDLSIVKIYSSELVYQPDLVSRLVATVSGAAGNTYAMSTSLSTIAFLIPSNKIEDVISKISTMHEIQVEKYTVKSNVALICCVGDNMINMPGVAAKVFANISETGANIEMISEGASDVALNFVIPDSNALDAVRNIHREFIGGQNERI